MGIFLPHHRNRLYDDDPERDPDKFDIIFAIIIIIILSISIIFLR